MFTRPRWSLWQRLMLAVLAIALFLISYQWGQQWRQQHSPSINNDALAGLQLRPPVPLPIIALQDQYGTARNSTVAWSHQWTLLTVLPDDAATIQTTVARLIAIHNRLAAVNPPVYSVIILSPAALAIATAIIPAAAPIRVYSASAAHQLALRTVLQLPDHTAGAGGELLPLYFINPAAHAQVLFPVTQSAAAIAIDITRIIHATATHAEEK